MYGTIHTFHVGNTGSNSVGDANKSKNFRAKLPGGPDKLLGMLTRIGAPLSERITAGEFDSADRCDAAQ